MSTTIRILEREWLREPAIARLEFLKGLARQLERPIPRSGQLILRRPCGLWVAVSAGVARRLAQELIKGSAYKMFDCSITIGAPDSPRKFMQFSGEETQISSKSNCSGVDIE